MKLSIYLSKLIINETKSFKPYYFAPNVAQLLNIFDKLQVVSYEQNLFQSAPGVVIDLISLKGHTKYTKAFKKLKLMLFKATLMRIRAKCQSHCSFFSAVRSIK